MNFGDPKALPQSFIDAMSEKDRKELGVLSTEERLAKAEKKSEAKLQADVESYLRQKGFWPRTDAFLDGQVPPMGWYWHLNPKKTKGNPYILDLLIWTLDGLFMELELKVPGGRVRDVQKVILDVQPCSAIAYSLEEAIKAVNEHLLDRISGGSVQ